MPEDIVARLSDFALRRSGAPIDAEAIEELMRTLGWDVRDAAEIASMQGGMAKIEYMPNYGDRRTGAPQAYLRIAGVPRMAIAICASLDLPTTHTDFNVAVRDVLVYLEQHYTYPTIDYLLATDSRQWILYDIRREEQVLWATADNLAPLAVLERDALVENMEPLEVLPRRRDEQLIDGLVAWLTEDGPDILEQSPAASQVLAACLLIQAVIFHKLWLDRGQIWLNILRLPANAYSTDRLVARTLASIAGRENLKLCVLPAGSWQADSAALLGSITGLSRSKFESLIFLAAYAKLANASPIAPNERDPGTILQQLAPEIKGASLKELSNMRIELTATREILQAGVIYRAFMQLAEAYHTAETQRQRPATGSIGGSVVTLADLAARDEESSEGVGDIPRRILECNLRVVTDPGALQAVEMSLLFGAIDTYAAGFSRYERFPDLEQAILRHA